MGSPPHLQALRHLFESAPVSRYLGHELVALGGGRAEVRLPYRDEFDQGFGVVHGGIVATLADTAGYFAAASLLEDGVVTTVEFKVNLAEAARRETLVGVGEAMSRGRSLIVCRMTVRGADDRVVAVAQGTYAIRESRRA